jgi:hypothetical protein
LRGKKECIAMLPQQPAFKAFIIDGRSLGILPVCAKCGQPITNFEQANLAVDGSGDPIGPAQDVDGLGLQPLEGRVIAIHWKCDRREHWPWKPLSSVFRADQRSNRDLLLEFQEEK